MITNKIIVRLKGGLGNQMFQYATGRALALKNDMQLILDTTSGFIRDKVYKRTFALNSFPISTEVATNIQKLPFWIEVGLQKYGFFNSSLIQNRPWGYFIRETKLNYLKELYQYNLNQTAWVEGHWQSEQYFINYNDIIASEFTLPAPQEPLFLDMAEIMKSCNSVAVGVRVFEEMLNEDKSGVGGLVPFSFYENAAIYLTEKVKNPVFFVFCTKSSNVENKLQLPGKIYYITSDNGFNSAVKSLWLMSQCRHHIIANSSFYWWGAWLGEYKNSNSLVIASNLFANINSIPERWLSI